MVALPGRSVDFDDANGSLALQTAQDRQLSLSPLCREQYRLGHAGLALSVDVPVQLRALARAH